MRKVAALLLLLTLLAAITACGSTVSYEDGIYYAEQDEFDATSGWKENVTISVSDGKISSVNWNGVYKDGTRADKKTESKNGAYGMKDVSSIGKEWDEQAEAMEAKLIEVQNPDNIKVTSDGKADGVSGCTINVNGFLSLAKKALYDARK